MTLAVILFIFLCKHDLSGYTTTKGQQLYYTLRSPVNDQLLELGDFLGYGCIATSLLKAFTSWRNS